MTEVNRDDMHFAMVYEEEACPGYMVRNPDVSHSGVDPLTCAGASLDQIKAILEAADDEGVVIDFPTTPEILARKFPDLPIAQLNYVRGLTRAEILEVLDLEDDDPKINEVTTREFDNSYLDGKVNSMKAEISGWRVTYGQIEAGVKTEFSTEAEEHITIAQGELKVQIEGSDTWKTYHVGETFVVPADSSFKLETGLEKVVYRCLYIDNAKVPRGLLEHEGSQMQFSVRYHPEDSSVVLDYRGRYYQSVFDKAALDKGDHIRFILEALEVAVGVDFGCPLAKGIVEADLERGLKSEIKAVLERAFAPYDISADLQTIE